MTVPHLHRTEVGPSGCRLLPGANAGPARRRRGLVGRTALYLAWLGFAGLLLTACGGGGLGSSGFSNPRGVATSPQGNVYVLDAGNSRIVEMSPTGQKLRVWNTNPKNYGDNDRPYGIWVDRYGDVYTSAFGCPSNLSGSCDAVHERGEIFSPGGRLILLTRSLEQTALASDPYGNIYSCSGRFGKLRIRRLPPVACSSSAVLEDPYTWVVDAQGRLLQGSGPPCSCVSHVSTSVNCVGVESCYPWQALDVGNTFDGQVLDPLAVDVSGHVYALETPNLASGGGADRVAKIAPNGSVQAVWTGFANATGVAVGRDGSVYITDADRNQVVKLSANGKKLAVWSGPKG